MHINNYVLLKIFYLFSSRVLMIIINLTRTTVEAHMCVLLKYFEQLLEID